MGGKKKEALPLLIQVGYILYLHKMGGGKRFKNTPQHCVVMKTSSLSVHKVDFVQYVCGNKAIASFLLTFTNDVSG